MRMRVGLRTMSNLLCKFKESGLLLPLILSVVGVFILVSLGNWQMKRKAWKETLISQVTERVDSAPLAFKDVKAKSHNLEALNYQPVRVRGVFDHSQERHYFLPHNGKVGWHIITPFETDEGDILFVDRGFVPDTLKEADKRPKGLIKGEQTIEGLVRLSEVPNYFSPKNNVRQNKWYVRDLSELYGSLNASAVKPLPFMIDQKRVGTSGEWPLPGVTKVKFTDKHLGYALTWYGLAMTLIGVFAAFSFSRLSGKKD